MGESPPEPFERAGFGAGSAGGRRFAIGATLFGIALAVALVVRLPALTRPLCWVWPYRDLALGRALPLFLPGLALWALGFALARGSAGRRQIVCALALFAGASAAFQVGSLLLDEHGWATLELRVADRYVTSYYTDAEAMASAATLLRGYPPPGLHAHSRTHPPGPILYYWLMGRVFGAHGAEVGGLLVGLGAAAIAPALYLFAGLWTAEPRARLAAAALWPLLPAVAGFFPELDQIYPLLTMALTALWLAALRGSRGAALGTGALAALALFLAWNLLLLAMLAVLLVVRHLLSRSASGGATTLSRALLFGALGFAAATLVPVVGAGYRPLHALEAALVAQAAIGLEASCPWRRAIFAGPWDFALGAGGVPILLWGAEVVRALRARAALPAALTSIGAATILGVDLSGRLPQETARVWLFLMPFVLVPAGLTLARLTPRYRLVLFATQISVFVAAAIRLVYIAL